MSKTCSKCGETKPIEHFSIDRSKANGRVSRCKACVALRDKQQNAAKTDAQRAGLNAHRRERYALDLKYREQRLAEVKQYAAANSETKRRVAQAWREANPERHRHNSREWQKANPGKARAISGRKRAAKINAVPAWADKGKIDAIYEEAAELRALGVDVEVDHIVPLQGKTVRGLHVHTNLRLLLATDNAAKGNRTWPDMP